MAEVADQSLVELFEDLRQIPGNRWHEPFYVTQDLYDRIKDAGMDNMAQFEVIKELPRVPDYTFTVRMVEPKRVKGQTAQWKAERGARFGGRR